jgi:hypothetical protein
MDAITDIISHFIVAAIFIVAIIMSFWLLKKLYGGRFTSAIPYFLIGISLLLGLVILDQIDLIYPSLNLGSDAYMHGVQLLQVVALIFFIKALYEIYQARFATEGFFELESKKGGRR